MNPRAAPVARTHQDAPHAPAPDLARTPMILFVVSFGALRASPSGASPPELKVGLDLIRAADPTRALEVASKFAHYTFPTFDGWSGHVVSVRAITTVLLPVYETV